ncbi:MAG TPA: hypothetical protein VHP32_01865 [Ignavibacteria bacterium]|nr:hypothetical protein [Ignavibacteria bacterium]
MKSFFEAILNFISYEEYLQLKEPKILHYFYRYYVNFIPAFDVHKIDDVKEYLSFLNNDLGLDLNLSIEFLLSIKSDYKTYIADISINETDKQKYNSEYLEKLYAKKNKLPHLNTVQQTLIHGYDLGLIYAESAKTKKDKDYIKKEYHWEFFENRIKDVNKFISYLDIEIEKLTLLNKDNDLSNNTHQKPLINLPYKKETINKIKWKGTESELTYLIEKLVEKKFISSLHPYSDFNKHFCKEDGKRFNFHQSKQNYLTTRETKPKSAYKIDDVIPPKKPKK